MTDYELVNEAIKAKKYAMTPTNYHCGAAILASNGKVYSGCNLGSKDGIFNICAERVAVCKMLSEGEKSFSKIAVVGGVNDSLTYTTPCGVCRQLISEFGEDIEVICGFEENNEIKIKKFRIIELLPETFNM